MEPLKAGQYYRCSACGNLTRFDVTETESKTSFYHFTTGGEIKEVIDIRPINHTVEEVTCRWCGSGKAIEVMEGPDTS